MTEQERKEFYKELNEKVKQLRIETLFEEPCPLYEEVEEE
jgi:hypothetical protein